MNFAKRTKGTKYYTTKNRGEREGRSEGVHYFESGISRIVAMALTQKLKTKSSKIEGTALASWARGCHRRQVLNQTLLPSLSSRSLLHFCECRFWLVCWVV